MKEEDEAVLMVRYGLDIGEAEELTKFANATRASVREIDSGDSFDGMTEPVCLRHMISYAKMRHRGVVKTKAFAAAIIGSLASQDRQVANELALTHMNND